MQLNNANSPALSKELSDEQKPEVSRIRKDSTFLLNDHFKDPKTVLLVFFFEAHSFVTTYLRVKDCTIEHVSIEGKDVYVLDHFFLKKECDEMRDFSRTTGFSRNIFASSESEENGEKPARSMDSKERWRFFSNPPGAINEIYKLFGFLAEQMDAEISTLPWDLCHQTKSSSAIATNFVEEMSYESMELGKHKDYNPEKGLSFGIPVLYSQNKEFQPSHFINGEKGRPWLVSVMVYSASDGFLPEYGMGTTYYNNDGTLVAKTECKDMRIVIFEGDISHSIEKSTLPLDTKVWRVSYVFKLIINPRHLEQNVKEFFSSLVKKKGLE